MATFVCEQDKEDFEQELLIKKWADQSGVGALDFKHITSKGTARNTLVKCAFSLDQKIKDDSSGTFADFIAGSDGRDLVDRGFADDFDKQYAEAETIFSQIIGLAKTLQARDWAMRCFLESIDAAA